MKFQHDSQHNLSALTRIKKSKYQELPYARLG